MVVGSNEVHAIAKQHVVVGQVVVSSTVLSLVSESCEGVVPMKKLISVACLLMAVVSLALANGADEAKTKSSGKKKAAPAATASPAKAAPGTKDTPAKAAAGTKDIVKPETMLPASAVAAFVWEGQQAHLAGLKETAAWKALEETELNARLLELVKLFASAAGEDAGQLVHELIHHLRDNGVSMAVAISGDDSALSPYGAVVLHNAAEYLPAMAPYIEQFARGARVEVETRVVSDRQVMFVNPGPPGVSISWWNEGGHIVVAGGMQAVEQVLATATGKTENITKSEHWTNLRKSDRYTVQSFGWLNLARVMNQFGDQTLPPTPSGDLLTIREVAEFFGLHNLKEITMQSGYHGAQTWTDARFVADGELTGIMALFQQRVLSLEELPPMPKGTSGFAAFKFDTGEAYDEILGAFRSFLTAVEPNEVQDFDEAQVRAAEIFGGDIREELFGAFGDLWCVYNDPAPMPIPIGVNPVFVASVKDSKKLAGGIDKLMNVIQQAAGNQNFSVRHTTKDGRESYSLNLTGMPFVPTMTIAEKWLVIGLTPGNVQSFFQREAGKIPKWKAEGQVLDALNELPKEFSSITVSDPAPSYSQALQYAPMALNLIEQQALPNIGGGQLKMPFAPEDLPAAELVVEPMFPNVSVSFSIENGFGSTSRQSVPSTPVGNVSGGAVVPILVALLLPAVQQAREAARRTQSKNNLKQLALAMHNYADTYGHFPQGTVENEKLTPEERLSWGYSVLPYMEQAPLYNSMNAEEGWQSDANAKALQAKIPSFQNPSQSGPRVNPSAGDYVAISGIGEDSALLENDDPKAGIFGYNRVTQFRDITDGTSNTLLIMDSSEPNESFLAGGRATVRGFSQSPYLNGPDGIGSPHTGVVQACLADGSVRAISVNIDETVLEALATKAGGEVIGEF